MPYAKHMISSLPKYSRRPFTMAASSTLSNTLKSITVTKIKELEKRRSSYNNRRLAILTATDERGADVSVDRVAELYAGVLKVPGINKLEPELQHIGRWLDQARYDATLPQAKLESIETTYEPGWT